MKTEAIILAEIGRLELVELEIPPLKRGQVLVEIAYSGACGTQLGEIAGARGPDKWLPHCLGHEGTGIVLEVGEGVEMGVDEKVVVSWLAGDGIDAGGTTYRCLEPEARVNAGPVHTFQRHAVISENRLSLLPDNISLANGTLLGCAAPTGMGAVLKVLPRGSSIAIFGCGGVGCCACMAASFVFPTVVAVDPIGERRKLALKYGANYEFWTPPVDMAVEASGNEFAMLEAIAKVKPRGGRVVIIGNAPHEAVLRISPSIFNQGKSLLGTWGGDSTPEDFQRYANILNQFDLGSLLSKPYALKDIPRALADMRAGKIGRPLIDMSL